MVDWKKEIKLSDLVPRSKGPREPKPGRKQAPEPRRERAATAEKSVWKKEISFRRKPKQAKPKTVEPRRVADAKPKSKAAKPDSTPFWKKEISFGRKPKQEQQASEPTSSAKPTPTPVVPPAESADETTWPVAALPDEPPAPATPDPPAASRPPIKEPAGSPVPSRRLSRLRGLSVPRPKLPGRPGRRARDGGGPPKPASRRRASGRPQFFRARFERKRKPASEETAAKTRGRRLAGKVPRPMLGRHPKTQLVGLKIGASQLAAAQVVNNGAPELVQVAREPLEPGIVVGGEPRDFDALVAALRDFFRKHRLPRRGVRLGIANNRIGVRSFEISGIENPQQLANAVKFRAQEVLPIPVDQAVMDYQVLEERVDSEGVTRRRILLVVAYRDLIDRYVAACRQAGIKLVGIDLEAFALLRALAKPSQLPPGRVDAALVVVSIGHEQSTFALSDGQSCDFTRVFDWGGASLNIAIARALDITPSQAEPIKHSLSLARSGDPGALPEDRAEKAREVVLQQLQAFARDLVSSLHFYQNQPGSLSIGEIVLTGGTAHLPGLPEELQRLIGVPVHLGDPLGRLKPGTRLDTPDELGSLSVAIGLGMEA